mmetsp:Transcript_75966/g.180681  ORF Transcript_75966/g.180681 Transcript_75966/m.180681 type:complete len:221 (+) Transcript_75966:1248-1910(+)
MRVAIPLVHSADKERISLQIVEVDEQTILRHVLRAESARNATGHIGQGILDSSSTSEDLPAAFAQVVILPPRCPHLGISLFYKRRPQYVRKELRPAANWKPLTSFLTHYGAHGHVVIKLHSHADSIHVDTNYEDRQLGVPAVEEAPCELWPECYRLHGLYEVPIVQLTLDDFPVVRHIGFVVEDSTCTVRRLVGPEVCETNPCAVVVRIGHQSRALAHFQ